jgi:hypothetical protein
VPYLLRRLRNFFQAIGWPLSSSLSIFSAITPLAEYTPRRRFSLRHISCRWPLRFRLSIDADADTIALSPLFAAFDFR